jgi:uncharacterized membrane protein HdeD (DUF308 family)
MRILTVIAGILLSACGAFCFAVYQNAFADAAFLVGLVMVIAGGCTVAAYLVSGWGSNRTTDTSLVEGLGTLLYGFAVLNNQVTDSTLTMFFGTWLTLCGITRVSQSFYVSRFRPSDWAKIMPLAAITSMLGIVMMMPKLVSAVMPLMLLGGAFILDGLSMLIYAMFMKKSDITSSEAEAKAHERAAAKKALAIEKRKERDRLRSLSKQEREVEQERQRQQREAEEEARRRAKAEARAARRAMARPATELTIQFTPEETAQIKAADSTVGMGSAKNVEESKEPVGNVRDVTELPLNDGEGVMSDKNDKEGAVPFEKGDKGMESGKNDEEGNKPTKDRAETPLAKPVWQKPKEIPSLRVAAIEERENGKEEDFTPGPLKFTAVNLEEIESKKPEIEFEKVALPDLKLASENGTVSRDEVLNKIDNVTLKHEGVDYTPINLEELVAEPLEKPYDPEESKRFTQTLNFDWLEDK